MFHLFLSTSHISLCTALYTRFSTLRYCTFFLDSCKFVSETFQLTEYRYLSILAESFLTQCVFDRQNYSVAFLFKGGSWSERESFENMTNSLVLGADSRNLLLPYLIKMCGARGIFEACVFFAHCA
jgi:hypothetical protein